MINPTAQPMMYPPTAQPTIPQQPTQPQAQPAQQMDPKQILKEQSLAISSDICAEYGAITRLNDILVSLAENAKKETNPEQKKLLEARINTINQMTLQREMKINQMEMTRAQIDAQIKA